MSFKGKVMSTERPIHVGEHLAEILDELEISPHNFAAMSDLPLNIIDDLLKGRQLITEDIAISIAKTLDMTPETSTKPVSYTHLTLPTILLV